MAEAMTPRERWLAALKCQPVDRLPFWAKLDGSYPPYQVEPFRSMSIGDIHKWVGSVPPAGCAACVKVTRRKTSTKSHQENGTRVTEYITPAGTLTAVNRFDEGSHSWHPMEFPVKRREDIEAMTLFFSDATCEFDSDQLDNALVAVKNVGETSVVTTGIGISPLMDWIQHLAGIENAHFMLWDYREDVEALFEAMHTSLRRRAEIIAEKSPAPVVFSTENTSTTLISPRGSGSAFGALTNELTDASTIESRKARRDIGEPLLIYSFSSLNDQWLSVTEVSLRRKRACF